MVDLWPESVEMDVEAYDIFGNLCSPRNAPPQRLVN